MVLSAMICELVAMTHKNQAFFAMKIESHYGTRVTD